MIINTALHQVYSNAVKVLYDENADTLQAWDSSGNEINIDRASVDSVLNKENLRVERNRRLSETDYWAASDTPDMTAEQTTYRQALRDITDTYSSLDTVVWPTKP